MNKKVNAVFLACLALVLFSLVGMQLNDKGDFDICNQNYILGWNSDFYSKEAGLFYEEIKYNNMKYCNKIYPKLNVRAGIMNEYKE